MKLTDETKAKIDRCLEIEIEYDSIKDIKLSSEDIEDISDLYQEKLEQQYYKQDLREEYKQLSVELGYGTRDLMPVINRRSIEP